jgi:hypothetical protein
VAPAPVGCGREGGGYGGLAGEHKVWQGIRSHTRALREYDPPLALARFRLQALGCLINPQQSRDSWQVAPGPHTFGGAIPCRRAARQLGWDLRGDLPNRRKRWLCLQADRPAGNEVLTTRTTRGWFPFICSPWSVRPRLRSAMAVAAMPIRSHMKDCRGGAGLDGCFAAVRHRPLVLLRL